MHLIGSLKDTEPSVIETKFLINNDGAMVPG